MFKRASSFTKQLCGASWVRSKARKQSMFLGSSGSIPQATCRTPSTQRWLARWQMANMTIKTSLTALVVASAVEMCPNCGTFKKSGRVSCCATDGAWYKDCGGVGNGNAGHSWFDGIEACNSKSNVFTAVDICCHIVGCDVDNFLSCLTVHNMSFPAVTATLNSSPCSECGTIPRSGKLSCCGHGGSWFGNCGNVGNANFGHTWNEGIQVCKSRQSQAAVGQQLRAPRPKSNVSSNDDSASMNFKEVVVTTQRFVSKPATTSTPKSSSASMSMPFLHVNASIITHHATL